MWYRLLNNKYWINALHEFFHNFLSNFDDSFKKVQKVLEITDYSKWNNILIWGFETIFQLVITSEGI